MNHHLLMGRPLLAALAGAVAVTLISGCSGSSDAALGSESAQVAAKAVPAELAAGAAASARIAAGGLELSLPTGLRLNFEPTPTTSATAAAMLEDSAAMFAAMYQAIGRGDPDDSLYQRYVTGAAADEVAGVISMFSTSDWTVSGHGLVFNRQADTTGPDTGRVSWCADVRRVYPQELDSGEVLRSNAGSSGVIAYTGTVRRGAAGVWVLTTLKSERAAPACL
ncbi:MAG: hypothetical protein L0Y54_06260 [Sporichthyaceae bacterium]|nr:hypothetical protein [Sporichthyaceae bacterium]